MNAGEPRPVSRRLRAPREHGGTLIDPPLADVGALLSQNLARRQSARCDVLGLPLDELAPQARRELIEAAYRTTRQYRDVPAPPSEGPLLLAGHQPQLFHGGVWFKNFVLAGLAAAQRGLGINLVIDSDTLRSPAIRVPGGSLQAPTAHAIAFDAPGPQIPFEERAILDRGQFRSFGDRAAAEIAPLIPAPLVREFWPLVVAQSNATGNLGACLARGRHLLEGQWGAATLELPQSAVCRLPSFHRFCAHLLLHATHMREVYNGSLQEYRQQHHVRSKNHPASELAVEDGWIEAPFWIWSQADPRRRRLFVRPQSSGMQLTDRAGLNLSLAAEGERLMAGLSELASRGVKLRTRALITTLWARLALSDLFLHGIGGAKYDQLTDLILERFFHAPAPSFLTVTATLRLPLEVPAIGREAIQHVQGQLRGLEFHPEHWLDRALGAASAAEQSEARQLLDEKRRWIATPQTRDNARRRCRGIRAANEALSRWTRGAREELLENLQSVERQERASALLRSREFAFCLFPEKTLRDFLLEFPAGNSYPRAT